MANATTSMLKEVGDVLTEAPTNAQLIFENPFVKVTEVFLLPGEEVPAHRGADRLIYSLSDYTIRWEDEREHGEESWKAGDAHWHFSSYHRVKNIGRTRADFLVVQRKNQELPTFNPLDINYDENQNTPEYAKLILENDFVRVTEIDLAPGRRTSMHEGIFRLIFSLNDYRLRFVAKDGDFLEKLFRKGEIKWYAPGQHSLANSGYNHAKFAMIAFEK